MKIIVLSWLVAVASTVIGTVFIENEWPIDAKIFIIFWLAMATVWMILALFCFLRREGEIQ